MDGEVAALDAVVEPTVDSQVLAHVPERLEQRGLLGGGAGSGGKQVFHLIAEQISPPTKRRAPAPAPLAGCTAELPPTAPARSDGSEGRAKVAPSELRRAN